MFLLTRSLCTSTVELVTSSEKMKDGRTVKQLLIDTYAENEKNEKSSSPNEDPKITEVEEKSLKDVKHGPKYQTPFWLQTYVLAKRTFKQRRHDILSWDKIILILCISVLSGLLWLQMDKDGTQLLLLVPMHAMSDLYSRLIQRNRWVTERVSCSSPRCSGASTHGSTRSLPVRFASTPHYIYLRF